MSRGVPLTVTVKTISGACPGAVLVTDSIAKTTVGLAGLVRSVRWLAVTVSSPSGPAGWHTVQLASLAWGPPAWAVKPAGGAAANEVRSWQEPQAVVVGLDF